MCYTQSLKSITMLVVHPDAGTRVSRRAKHHLCRLRGGGRNALGVHTLWLGSVEIQNAEIHDPGVELAYEAQITTVACGEADRVCVARLHCKKSREICITTRIRRNPIEIFTIRRKGHRNPSQGPPCVQKRAVCDALSQESTAMSVWTVLGSACDSPSPEPMTMTDVRFDENELIVQDQQTASGEAIPHLEA